MGLVIATSCNCTSCSHVFTQSLWPMERDLLRKLHTVEMLIQYAFNHQHPQYLPCPQNKEESLSWRVCADHRLTLWVHVRVHMCVCVCVWKWLWVSGYQLLTKTSWGKMEVLAGHFVCVKTETWWPKVLQLTNCLVLSHWMSWSPCVLVCKMQIQELPT